jgi:hypothetical protein
MTSRRWTRPPCPGSFQPINEATREQGFTALNGHVYRDTGECPYCQTRVSIVSGHLINRHLEDWTRTKQDVSSR